MAAQYDAIVIGAGQAGPSLAHRLTSEGLKTALIERKYFGGTCVNTGCIPTKTLVASARAAFMARRAGDFGVEIDGDIRVDMKKVKARKDSVAGKSNRGVEGWLKGLENATVYEGHARFESCTDGLSTLRVGDDLLETKQVFLNVGARAFIPPMPGLDQVEYIKNANEEGFVMVQIETVEAVENLEEIITTPGVDAYLVGPSDLSASMGHTGDVFHPDVQDMIEQIVTRGKKAGVPGGFAATTIEVNKKRVEQGFQWITLGSDISFMKEAANNALSIFGK